VPGTDAYAGYLMAASGFLALAHTLKRGDHIRVTLVLGALPGPWKHRHGTVGTGFRHRGGRHVRVLQLQAGLAVHVFNDISTANDATPLWIPQIAMALGTVVLAVAFVDELVLEARGLRVTADSDEPRRNE
jgi:TRAP-type C4-dicarboxylate transport system permease small subunit